MSSGIRNVEMISQGVFRVLGVVDVPLPDTGGWWHTEDINDHGAIGAIFRAYDDPPERDTAYLLVADVTSDVSEPDVQSLSEADVPAMDNLLRKDITAGQAERGSPVVKWMSSKLHEGVVYGAPANCLVTTYIIEDTGIDRQTIVHRMSVYGRKFAIMGCFDVNKANPLEKTIRGAIDSVSFVPRCAAPSAELNLYGRLLTDFGFDLRISGGRGQSVNDPIVIGDDNPDAAAITQMQVLRGLGMGRRILWRCLGRIPIESDAKRIERLQIETKKVTPTEIVTTQEGYYFDVTLVDHQRSIQLPSAFTDDKSGVSLPYEIGWLHYESATRYPPKAGRSIAYGALGIKATIYVYDNGHADIRPDVTSELVVREFESAVLEMNARYHDVRPIAPAVIEGPALRQDFELSDGRTIVILTTCKGQFVKVRVTSVIEPIILQSINESIWALYRYLRPN